jgi:uncharacterized repeat protein (TIGR02543 family)/LPXTG-motif cell wall-anchored protein
MKRKIIVLISSFLLLLVLFPAGIFAADGDSDGYDDHDVAQLQAFLAQDSATAGKTNIESFAAWGWNINDPSTWTTWVTWSGTPKRLTAIYWSEKGLAGDLDLTGCTELAILEAYSNQLTSIDVPNLTKLTCLKVFFNDTLSSVDIEGDSALTELYVNATSTGTGQLTELDVSDASALQVMNCTRQQLTSLDISANTALYRLYSANNPFKEIKMTNNSSLLTATANGNGTIYLTIGGGSEGTDPTAFTAVPNAATTFVNWTYTLGGASQGTSTQFILPDSLTGTLYANFSKVTLTYDPNYSGASTWDELYNSGATLTAPTDPSRTGYIFGGWYTEATCDNAWDFSTDTVTQDTTLYAYWYNANDYNKIRNFLLKTSSVAGKTNGQMLNASFDADDPTTWSGVYWDDGYVEIIYWTDNALAGSLDLSDVNKMTWLEIMFNDITSLNVSGCEALDRIFCNNNDITELNLDDCYDLEVIWCFNNPLTSIQNFNGNDITTSGNGTIYLYMGYDFAYNQEYEQYIYAKGDNNMLFINFTKDGTVATEENVYFFEVSIRNGIIEDSSIIANFAPLTSDAQDGAIYKGGRFTITPPSQGGKWSFDEDFLSGNFTDANKPIFTGKKIGTTTISYTKLPDYEEIGEVELLSLSVSKDRAGSEYEPMITTSDISISADEADYTITMDVTIEKAELPQTGQDYTAPIALAGIGLAGAGSIVLIGRKKKA